MAVVPQKKETYTSQTVKSSKIITAPDYKEPLSLKRYVTDRGKIIPAKRTGVPAKVQRQIAMQVKRARFMALLPYTDRHAL